MKTLRGAGDWVRDVTPSFDGKWLVSGGRDQAATIWEVSSSEVKAVLLGHENYLECCVFAPPSSYGYLATLAGLKKPPAASSSAQFIATGQETRLSSYGIPGGKYLINAGDDKTIRCWDLSQEGRLVKTIDGVHGQFVSCIRLLARLQFDVSLQLGVRINAYKSSHRYHRIVLLLKSEPEGLEKRAVYHVRGNDAESSVKC